MNYVLYIIGSIAIVVGVILGVILLDGMTFNLSGVIVAQTNVMVTLAAALILCGIFTCAFGNVIGLLKQIGLALELGVSAVNEIVNAQAGKSIHIPFE